MRTIIEKQSGGRQKKRKKKRSSISDRSVASRPCRLSVSQLFTSRACIRVICRYASPFREYMRPHIALKRNARRSLRRMLHTAVPCFSNVFLWIAHVTPPVISPALSRLLSSVDFPRFHGRFFNDPQTVGFIHPGFMKWSDRFQFCYVQKHLDWNA